jgi:hypothetical protein
MENAIKLIDIYENRRESEKIDESRRKSMKTKKNR